MAKDRIRVLIAIDQSIARRGLAALVSNFNDLVLVGEAQNGLEALELCATTRPNIIMIDLLMEDMNGVEATTAIHKRYPDIHVIVMTNWTEYDLVQRALAAGAGGYLLKNVSPIDLADTIRLICNGQKQELAQPLSFGVHLTSRELEVLSLMSRGLTNGQIAMQLMISRATVKFHVSRVFGKMGVSSRTEAVGLAVQLHLVEGPMGPQT